MSVALVQKAINGTGGGQTNVTTTYGAATTAGNFLVAMATNNGGVGMTMPAGWTAAGSPQLFNSLWTQFYYQQNTAGGLTTVNVTVNSGSSCVMLHLWEFSGMPTSGALYDTAARKDSTGNGTALSGATNTLSDTVELVLFAYTDSNGFAHLTIDSGVTASEVRDSFTSSNYSTGTGYIISSSTTALTTGATGGTGDWTVMAIAFDTVSSAVGISSPLAPGAFALNESDTATGNPITAPLAPAPFALNSADTTQLPPTVSNVSPADTPVATTPSITITGANFTGATSVTIVGVGNVTSLVVVSDTQITAVVPSYAGPTTLATWARVNLPSGAHNLQTAGASFTYHGIPVVSSVSPNTGPTAGGGVALVGGSDLTNVTGVTVGGLAATFAILSDTQMHVTIPAASAGTVDLVATNAVGASATGAGDHYTYVAPPTVSSVAPASGPAGTTTTGVVITGTNFTTATDVRFGFRPAVSFIINSSTQITATAPAGSGLVDVTVIGPGGVSAISASDHFSYLPQPIITAVLPPFGVPAGGDTITVKGKLFDAAATVKFGATSAASVTWVDAQTLTVVTPAGTGRVDIRVTSNGIQSAIVPRDIFDFTPSPLNLVDGQQRVEPYVTGSQRPDPWVPGSQRVEPYVTGQQTVTAGS